MGGGGLDHSRRSLLRGVLRGLAMAMSAGLLTPWGRAESSDNKVSEKMTKARAGHRDTPNGIYSCATCTLFVPPHICTVVEGEVSRDGWCSAFAMAD